MIRLACTLVALVALLAGTEARAACVSDGVTVFPRSGAVVPTNPRFILEGRGSEAARVLALVGKQLKMTSDDGHTVVLDVRHGWKSDLHRNAVKLVPKGKLNPDARYRLQLEAVLPGVKSLDAPSATEVSWRTGTEPDKTRPKWTKTPGPSEGRYFFDDGKLHRELRFNMTLEEVSPVFVVVTLRRARGPALPQTYFAALSSSELTIGHDGCSGSFSFADGRAYFAKFEVFDVAGNRAAPIKPIELNAPRPVNH